MMSQALTYHELQRADCRYRLLQLLHQAGGDYTVGEDLLREGLAGFGHAVSADLIRTKIAWLQEQGLVTVRTIGDMMFATLAPRGADVLHGRADVPGVRRPRPGERADGG